MTPRRRCLVSLTLRWVLRLELLCWLSTSAQGGVWSSWSDWRCDSNGSYAVRNRSYMCGFNEVTNCGAVDTQVQSSPIRFEWSSWSGWVPPCNVTSQTRSRSCVIPRINFDLSTTAVCFNCGNQSQEETQLQMVHQTPCCQAIYQWSQWAQWTDSACSNPTLNRFRECVLSPASVPGGTTECETCLSPSSQFESPGNLSTNTTCVPLTSSSASSSSSILLPILLTLLVLTVVRGAMGVAFFTLCLREVKMHRTYTLSNRQQQTRRPRLDFGGWREEAIPPSNDYIGMLPRDDSAHSFRINPQRNIQMVHTGEGGELREKDGEESTTDGNPLSLRRTAGVVPTRLRLPTGGESLDENLYEAVSDTKSLMRKELTESGEGIEMTSISSPLYEPSDEEGSVGESEEVTII